MTARSEAPPASLWGVTLAVGTLFWGLAGLRHALLQSNAFDLGLFDQWAWQISRGLEPVSSQSLNLHLLNDHGAWLFYGIAPLYRLAATVEWLLALQAFSLALTALPLWILARQSGLSGRLRWTVCLLWWLQPVVFNTNLFDFHPEVLAMPLLAALTIAGRRGLLLPWSVLVVLVLGWRDGLALVTTGMGLEHLLRRHWGLAALATGLSLGWLLVLTQWIQPPLLARYTGLNAGVSRYSYLGNSLGEILGALIREPGRILHHVDWGGAAIYLLLISLPLLPFWRRASRPALAAGLPLVLVNILSESGAQRSLVHHYSLPLALIGVMAAIDGLAASGRADLPWRRLAWAGLCWVALAKPWFFTGPYLDRLTLIPSSREAIVRIGAADRVATTSYLAPHLSERPMVLFPTAGDSVLLNLEREHAINVLLLNPGQPGWASPSSVQRELLSQARQNGWLCHDWPSQLQLCRKPSDAVPAR